MIRSIPNSAICCLNLLIRKDFNLQKRDSILLINSSITRKSRWISRIRLNIRSCSSKSTITFSSKPIRNLRLTIKTNQLNNTFNLDLNLTLFQRSIDRIRLIRIFLYSFLSSILSHFTSSSITTSFRHL